MPDDNDRQMTEEELASAEALERARAVLEKTAELSPKLMEFVGKELIPSIGKFMEREMFPQADEWTEEQEGLDHDLSLAEITAACVAIATELSFWQTLYMHMEGDSSRLAQYMGIARQKGLDVFRAFMTEVQGEEKVLKLRDTITRN